jgi:glycosyltransferase involved in cell wall biosynthesis
VEIIAVDDRSDNANDIAEYSQIRRSYPYVRYFTNDREKKGAGTCRNIGLENARGKWIIFADADDYFAEDAFNIIFRYLDDSSDIVFFSPFSVNVNTGKEADRHTEMCNMIDYHRKNHSQLSENLLRYFWSGPVSKMIRRDMVREHGIGFDEVIIANDVMFSMKCGLFARSINVCKDTFYIITRSADSLTVVRNPDKFIGRIKVNVKRYLFLKKNMNRGEFKDLGLSSGNWLIACIKEGYGFKLFFRILKIFIRYRVPVFTFNTIRNYRVLYRNDKYKES